MAKWTKGPWKVEDEYEIYSVIPSNELLATIYPMKRDGLHDSWKANARLIAKSPEMAEMIRELLEELRLIRMKDSNAVYDPSLRTRAKILLAEIE